MLDGFCGCGCGERTRIAGKTDRRAGQTKGQPLRFVDGHNLRVAARAPKMDPDSSWAAEDRGYATPCHVWQRGLTNAGYGWTGSRRTLAHRFFYERECGLIPEGLQIDHLCRNRACVNVEHMEVVTNAENARRGARAKLTATDVAAIRSLSGSHAEAARRFGVSATQIGVIRRGLQWVDV